MSCPNGTDPAPPNADVDTLPLAVGDATRGRSKTVVKVLTAAAIWCALLYAVDIDRLAGSMRIVHPLDACVAVMLVVLSLWGNGLTYYFVAKPFGVSLGMSTDLATRAWTYGLFTPARVGELWVGHSLRARGVPLAEVVACVLVVRLLLLAFHVMLALPLVFLTFASMQVVAPLTAAACLFTVGLVLRPEPWRALARVLPGRLGAKLEPLAHPEALRIMRRPSAMAGIVSTQLVRLLLMFSASYALFRALGVAVPWLDIVTVNSVARFSSLVPISISGLGVRESVQTWLFHRVSGVDAAAVVAMGIWMNVITYGLAGCVHLLSALRSAARPASHA